MPYKRKIFTLIVITKLVLIVGVPIYFGLTESSRSNHRERVERV
jgi:hypothetical protein